MDALLDVARRADCHEAWVLTNRSNEAAARLYTAAGGQETPGQHMALKPKDFQRRVEEQVEGAFRELTDAAVNAKLTLGAVLQHPLPGFGPDTGGLARGAPERQQIAMVGGLSSRNLRLL